MKARRTSRCTVCGYQIQVGDEIEAFLGKWTHAACKAADIARRAELAGPPVELPTEDLDNETITYVGTRHWRRRGLKFLRSQERL
jgi:hypothetical protein